MSIESWEEFESKKDSMGGMEMIMAILELCSAAPADTNIDEDIISMTTSEIID